MRLMIILIIMAIMQVSLSGKSEEVLPAPGAARLSVKINEIVEVHNQRKVRLYDIVELENATKEQVQEFKDTVIEDQFLQNEFQTRLSTLVRDYKNLFRGAQLKIPDVIKVKKVEGGNSSILSRQHIARDINNHIRLICGDCETHLSHLNLPNFQVMDDTEIQIDFSNLSLKTNFLSPLTISDRYGVRSYWLSGQLRIEKPTYILNKNLAMGSAITEGDIMLVRKELSNSMNALFDKSKIIGAKLSRTLQQGSSIRAEDLRKEYAIQRGQTVKVVSTTEQFELSVQAIAEQNASIGENIKLKNPLTKKDLVGVVKEKGVVEIQ